MWSVKGANMPSVPGAVDQFIDSKILYGPGKAANAGGVAVSGLEMAQNSMRLAWPREEVDARLKQIMKSIHETCIDAADNYGVFPAIMSPGPISPGLSKSLMRCWIRGWYRHEIKGGAVGVSI
jgi:glutamate dehydrogenase/leucine dehydrogenase